MATKKLLRVFVKQGDKQCAQGKEWAALRDGMVISWQRIERTAETGKQTDGPLPGVRDLIAFRTLEVDDTWSTEQALREACAEKEFYNPDGSRDKKKWRSRAGFVGTAIAAKTVDADVPTKWAAKEESVEPLYVSGFSPSTDIQDSGGIDFGTVVVADVNAVSTGSYTVGTGGGQDYSTWGNAFADMAGLTGALTFTQTSDTTETGIVTTTEALNSNTFTCTCSSSHGGDPTAGFDIDVNHGSGLFDFQNEGAGTVRVELLRGFRSVNGSNTSVAFVLARTIGTEFDLEVYNNMFDGAGYDGSGLRTLDATPIWYVKDNVIWSLSSGWLDATGVTHSSSIIENGIFFDCTVGINHNTGSAGTFRNLGCYDNGTDATGISGATGNNNAASDTTMEDGDWNVGSGNIASRSSATDFVSTSDASSDFMDLDPSGGLDGAGTLTILGDNIAGIRGRARPRQPTNTVSIGAAEEAAGALGFQPQQVGQEFGQRFGQGE